MTRPLGTQLVGSYTKPGWLIRHHRVTTPYDDDFWRPEPAVLAEAQDDATLLAIADLERAGLDVVTDGEQRRQRFDSYFFQCLEGLDTKRLGAWSMRERDMSFLDLAPEIEERLKKAEAPRVTGEVCCGGPITLEDLRFLKCHARKPVKMTVIGPLTTACRLANEYYENEAALGMAVAGVINSELRALQKEGLDLVQLDEPDFHFRHDQARAWGTAALDRALDGIETTTVVHVCYGYATIGSKRVDPSYGKAIEAIAASRADQICLEYEQPGHGPELLRHCGDKVVIVGLLDLSTEEVEDPARVADRIREILGEVPPERVNLAPDCGMWFLPRNVAYRKLRALVAGADLVRGELGLN